MKTGPLKIECFKVSHSHERGWRRIVVRDLQSAAGNATVGARLGRARRFCIRGSENAEIFRDAAITPDVAASFQRARVELIHFGHVAWLLSTSDGGAARCKGIGRWHWW